MKKIFLLALLVLIGSNAYSQKKKKAVAKKPAATAACVSKLDNLTAEVKSGNFQITIAGKGKTSDAIIIKSSDAGGAPSDCKLSSFTALGTKLYLLQWTEKSQIKTGNKTEDKTTIYSTVYEITNKKTGFFPIHKLPTTYPKLFHWEERLLPKLRKEFEEKVLSLF